MKKVNILLVDDRPENLTALEEVLRPLEQNLVRATTGEEALKMLLRQEFAVVLMDVRMPGMDGFQTAEYIKQLEKTRYIPIIFLTAISKDSHQTLRGYSVGAVDYVFKPFDPVILRSKVAVFVTLFQKTRALWESEETFRRTFDDAPIGVALVAPEERVCLRANRCLSEFAGRPATEINGKPIASIVHVQDAALDAAQFEDLRRGRLRTYHVEKRIVRPDGTEVAALFSVSLAHHADGAPMHVIYHVQDISAQKRAEEYTRRLAEIRNHQQQALELNDNVVQSLVLAKLFLETGDLSKAAMAVDQTLAGVRSIISDLISVNEGFKPGDLIRERAATPMKSE